MFNQTSSSTCLIFISVIHLKNWFVLQLAMDISFPFGLLGSPASLPNALEGHPYLGAGPAVPADFDGSPRFFVAWHDVLWYIYMVYIYYIRIYGIWYMDIYGYTYTYLHVIYGYIYIYRERARGRYVYYIYMACDILTWYVSKYANYISWKTDSLLIFQLMIG